jgi:hypothetical protein
MNKDPFKNSSDNQNVFANDRAIPIKCPATALSPAEHDLAALLAEIAFQQINAATPL